MDQADASSAPPPPEQTKRKSTESKSKYWVHFDKIVDNDGRVTKAKCKYCKRTYAADPKKHGTTTLKNHSGSCLQNPYAKETKQSMLAFQGSQFDNSEHVLGTWVFNQDRVRKALTRMIIIDELPFKFVEGRGFKGFVEEACPMFKIPSRWTINRDIFALYFEERKNLKKFFKENTQRMSITTDTWTSIQRINYMCITAHFIDVEWKLHKKIISFVPIQSHKGESIAKALEICLLDWGVKNIVTITVDNASSNDVAVGLMKLNWCLGGVRLLELLTYTCDVLHIS